MTSFENLFCQTMDWYEARNIPVFLHGSTLLRIIRDNTVEPRADVSHDQEINIGIRAEDFTDDIYRELKRESRFFRTVNNRLPNSLIFYSKEELNERTRTEWDILPGFTLLARYWKGKTKRVEYMDDKHCLAFPRSLFDTFGSVSLFGRHFNTPANPEKYLSYYFGDWKTENKEWHWSNATCYENWDELEISGEI